MKLAQSSERHRKEKQLTHYSSLLTKKDTVLLHDETRDMNTTNDFVQEMK